MPDGSPQVTAVWIDIDGSTVLLNTAEGRVKPRNLRRDGRIAIAIADRTNPYEAISIRGRVTEMTTEGAVDHIDSLAQKYLDHPKYRFSKEGDVRIIVRVEPEHVHYFNP